MEEVDSEEILLELPENMIECLESIKAEENMDPSDIIFWARCRGCCIVEEEMHNIFTCFQENLTLAQVITECTQYPCEKDDGYPSLLCMHCANVLIGFFNLKIQMKKTLVFWGKLSEEIGFSSVRDAALDEDIDPCPENNIDFDTENVIDPHTENVIDPHTENVIDPHTENVRDPHTENVIDPHTENVIDPYTEDVIDPYTEDVIDLCTENDIDAYPENHIDLCPENGIDPCPENNIHPDPENVTFVDPYSENYIDPYSENDIGHCPENYIDPCPEDNIDLYPENGIDPYPEQVIDSYPENIIFIDTYPDNVIDPYPDNVIDAYPDNNIDLCPDNNIDLCPDNSHEDICMPDAVDISADVPETNEHSGNPLFKYAVYKQQIDILQETRVEDEKIQKIEEAAYLNSLPGKLCRFCQQKFPEDQFKEHYETHKVYVCEKCGHKFLKKFDLDLHIQSVHNDVKNYTCNICDRAFKVKPLLKRHYKIHINPRSFCCHMCGQRFNDSGTLKTHINLKHFGTRDFFCPTCEKSFTMKSTLDKHIKRHNKNRTPAFYCVICKSAFQDKSSLNRHHIVKHTGKFVRPSCDFCGKTYCSSTKLRLHIKKCHGPDEVQTKQRGRKKRVLAEKYHISESTDTDEGVGCALDLPIVVENCAPSTSQENEDPADTSSIEYIY